MCAFATLEEASAYLAPLLDQPVTAEHVELTPHIEFRAEPVGLGGDIFTNSYTVSWSSAAASEIFVAGPPMCTAEYTRQRDAVVTATGGFFFLADRCRYRPRTLSLNLAVRDGKVLSLPAADQDALVDDGGTLSVVEVPARGELSLDGHTLRWSGTRTGAEADCHAYGNAHCVIEHEPDAHTGKVRTFGRSPVSPPRSPVSTGATSGSPPPAAAVSRLRHAAITGGSTSSTMTSSCAAPDASPGSGQCWNCGRSGRSPSARPCAARYPWARPCRTPTRRPTRSTPTARWEASRCSRTARQPVWSSTGRATAGGICGCSTGAPEARPSLESASTR